MSVRLHPEKLRFNLDTIGFCVDMAMIVLVIANLGLIIFDSLFTMFWLQEQLGVWAPNFFEFYHNTIHTDFVFWDTLFVVVYLTEFVVRWAFAAGRHTYERWYYYPFAHWYDLLGCIPVGSFRWLRILRLVSLLYRLQRNGILDLRETWLGALLLRSYRALVEEVSDRVVVNVLEGAQRELQTDAPLIQRIEREVLLPRKQDLITFVSTTLIDAADHSHRRWRLALGSYIASLTREALAHTSIGGTLNAIPGAGPRLLASLSAQAEEIGLAFADQIIADLKNPVHRSTVDAVLESLIIRAGGDRQALDHLIRDTLVALLDQVKEQVAVKQWQLTPSEPLV